MLIALHLLGWAALAVTDDVAWCDLTSFEQYIRRSGVRLFAAGSPALLDS